MISRVEIGWSFTELSSFHGLHTQTRLKRTSRETQLARRAILLKVSYNKTDQNTYSRTYQEHSLLWQILNCLCLGALFRRKRNLAVFALKLVIVRQHFSFMIFPLFPISFPFKESKVEQVFWGPIQQWREIPVSMVVTGQLKKGIVLIFTSLQAFPTPRWHRLVTPPIFIQIFVPSD